MIHALETGTALNRIELCSQLNQVHMIWMNRGYVTIAGKFSVFLRTSTKYQQLLTTVIVPHVGLIKDGSEDTDLDSETVNVIQSVSINGDYIGRPVYGEIPVTDIDGDLLKVVGKVSTLSLTLSVQMNVKFNHVNCLSGVLESWCEENI